MPGEIPLHSRAIAPEAWRILLARIQADRRRWVSFVCNTLDPDRPY